MATNMKAFREGLAGGFETYGHLVRFCTAVAFLSALAIFVAWLVVSHLPLGKRMTVSFNKEGATIISVDNQPSKAIVLVPANQIWTNTGLELNPGQRIRIAATGTACFAIHRLVQAADTDDRPRHGWVDPDGGELKNEKPVDRIRKPLRLEPRVGYGCLLAYVRPEGEPNPGKGFPRPSNIRVVGRNADLTYINSENRKGVLFFTMNEAPLADTPEPTLFTSRASRPR